MKKNKFLSLLGLMLMAAALTTFTACSGSDDDDNQSGTTYMYDDLDYFQKALCTIYFRAGTEPIVAEVTASAGTQLKFIDRITFLLNSAWPQNSGDEDMGINTNLGNDGELDINGDPDNSWGR